MQVQAPPSLGRHRGRQAARRQVLEQAVAADAGRMDHGTEGGSACSAAPHGAPRASARRCPAPARAPGISAGGRRRTRPTQQHRLGASGHGPGGGLAADPPEAAGDQHRAGQPDGSVLAPDGTAAGRSSPSGRSATTGSPLALASSAASRPGDVPGGDTRWSRHCSSGRSCARAEAMPVNEAAAGSPGAAPLVTKADGARFGQAPPHQGQGVSQVGDRRVPRGTRREVSDQLAVPGSRTTPGQPRSGGRLSTRRRPSMPVRVSTGRPSARDRSSVAVAGLPWRRRAGRPAVGGHGRSGGQCRPAARARPGNVPPATCSAASSRAG